MSFYNISGGKKDVEITVFYIIQISFYSIFPELIYLLLKYLFCTGTGTEQFLFMNLVRRKKRIYKLQL